MRRHVNIGQGIDLHDIARHDWPSVRTEIEANLYSELEPLPVAAENLADLVRLKPSGSVTTRLNWAAITAEEFERLLFNIVTSADGYANGQWLMHTNAPDHGRDISVERVSTDSLSGVRNQRVIIQAKHWLSKSIRPVDVSDTLVQVALWAPPRACTGDRHERPVHGRRCDLDRKAQRGRHATSHRDVARQPFNLAQGVSKALPPVIPDGLAVARVEPNEFLEQRIDDTHQPSEVITHQFAPGLDQCGVVLLDLERRGIDVRFDIDLGQAFTP